MTNNQLKELHEIFLNHPVITRDNRQVKEGDIFWALKGEKFDGNNFAEDALSKGAHIAVIDNIKLKNKKFYLVNNTLKALQDFGQFHRDYIGMPVIGITGSNGKTTTKELVNAVLSKLYNTSFTFKNLNNHIGVPLTLLDIPEETDIAIVEMGSNHFGEIETLVNIAKPNFGIITSIGKAHLEFFKNLEGVTREKSTLFKYLKTHNGLAFVNLDDNIINQISQDMKRYTFSFDKQKEADILLEDISTNPELKIKLGNTEMQTKLTGKYNLSNIGYAIAVGKYFNLTDDLIKEALETYTPKDMRSQIIEKNNNLIVLDAYNANPTSLKAAIDSLVNMQGNNKVAIVGDMFELGKKSAEEHQFIADYLKEKNIDAYLIGKNFGQTQSKYDKYDDTESFIKSKNFDKLKNATILIKGSRGMAMEKIIE